MANTFDDDKAELERAIDSAIDHVRNESKGGTKVCKHRNNGFMVHSDISGGVDGKDVEIICNKFNLEYAKELLNSLGTYKWRMKKGTSFTIEVRGLK